MSTPAARALLWPVTRIYELDRLLSAELAGPDPEPLHEWPSHLPVTPEGSMISVGGKCWRVRWVGIVIDEDRGESVLSYTVEDALRAPVKL